MFYRIGTALRVSIIILVSLVILLVNGRPFRAQEPVPARPALPQPVQTPPPLPGTDNQSRPVQTPPTHSQPVHAQPEPVLPQTVQTPQPMSGLHQPGPQRPTGVPRASSSPLATTPTLKGGVSFNFDDADLFDVARTVFGDILKASYMIDPKVKGRINFRTVAPIPKTEVIPIMETLLKLNGAGILFEKGIYRILPINEIPGTTPKVFVYPLQNSKATHIASMLQSMLAGGSHMPAGTQRVASTATTATTAATGGSKLGASVVAAGTGFLVAPETRLLADEITNSLIILATPTDYGFIEETIKKLDIVPRQVLIEVLIAEVTLQDQLQFGLEWLINTNLDMQISPLTNSIKAFGTMGQNSDLLPSKNTGVSGFSFIASDSSGQVRALLQALASDSKLNVLASPHIIAADNREARIQIGDQVPIATSQTTQVGTGNSIMTTIQYKDTGTILKVKPQINESGLVNLEVMQEVSDFTPQKVLGTDQYVISKREASTNLVARDGQTIIIGGLIKDKTDRTQTGIPFLSKIPVLGYLFGSTKDTKLRTELLVLLTPRVIRSHKEAADVTNDYMNRLKVISKDAKIEEFIKQKNNGHSDGDNKQ